MALRQILVIVGGATLVATCNAASARGPLDGLWARSQASCDMGLGVRFTADAVTLAGPDAHVEVARFPAYEQVETADGTRAVRVELAPDPSLRAMVLLELVGDEAELRVRAQTLAFRETGAAVASLEARDGVFAGLDGLRRCGQMATGLRGAL